MHRKRGGSCGTVRCCGCAEGALDARADARGCDGDGRNLVRHEGCSKWASPQVRRESIVTTENTKVGGEFDELPQQLVDFSGERLKDDLRRLLGWQWRLLCVPFGSLRGETPGRGASLLTPAESVPSLPQPPWRTRLCLLIMAGTFRQETHGLAQQPGFLGLQPSRVVVSSLS